MNRRMRNRTSGGVGGRQGRPYLLPDSLSSTKKTRPDETGLWVELVIKPLPEAKPDPVRRE